MFTKHELEFLIECLEARLELNAYSDGDGVEENLRKMLSKLQRELKETREGE